MTTKTVTITTYDRNGNIVGTRTVTWDSTPEQDNQDTLQASALSALDGNHTYLAIAAPTTAQAVAQVKALTRQNDALIRLALGALDGTD